MRILHIGKFYPPEYGGIESVTESLATEQAAAGMKVVVVCFSRRLNGVQISEGVEIHRCKTRLAFASQPMSVSFLFRMIALARNADIIHVHLPNIVAMVGLLLFFNRKPIVLHWHADILGHGFLGTLVRPLEYLTLWKASAVVVTSRAYAAASTALKSFAEKISVIPIGIKDLDKQVAPKADIPAYVLLVGRLVPYKGFDVLIKAMPQLKYDVEVRIVGEGPQRETLESLAVDAGVSGRVSFLGRLSLEELQQQLQGATIFCLPSLDRAEAFGVVLLEAMRASRAIVATEIKGSGVPWVNASGINVVPGDIDALASAINLLLGDPNLRDRLGAEGRSRFLSEFSLATMNERFLSLYFELLKTPH